MSAYIRNEDTEAIPTKIPTANITVEVVRPANTTAYTAGDLLNTSESATALPVIPFGATYANRYVMLTGLSIITDSTDLTKMSNFNVYLFRASTTIAADNAAFTPTYADYIAKRTGAVIAVADNYDFIASGGVGVRMATELVRKCQLDASGNLYFAPVVTSAITPASEQKFTFIFHFYIL